MDAVMNVDNTHNEEILHLHNGGSIAWEIQLAKRRQHK